MRFFILCNRCGRLSFLPLPRLGMLGEREVRLNIHHKPLYLLHAFLHGLTYKLQLLLKQLALFLQLLALVAVLDGVIIDGILQRLYLIFIRTILFVELGITVLK